MVKVTGRPWRLFAIEESHKSRSPVGADIGGGERPRQEVPGCKEGATSMMSFSSRAARTASNMHRERRAPVSHSVALLGGSSGRRVKVTGVSAIEEMPVKVCRQPEQEGSSAKVQAALALMVNKLSNT